MDRGATKATELEGFKGSLADLTRAWETSPEPSTKITSYFPVYARLFSHLRHTACVFIETGVLDGGSLFMWRSWLGPRATIVGVDLNPAAAKWREAGFQIFIGDQGDRRFWQDLFREVGPFDALLDDGGHLSFQQIVTVQEALGFATTPCVIAVEDTGTSFMRDFGCPSPNSFIEFCKAATDCLVARSFRMHPDRFPSRQNEKSIEEFKKVFSIEFYNAIVAFHVDPTKVVESRSIRNREPRGTSDFRHNGKASAVVNWPNVLNAEQRVVGSGATPPSPSLASRVLRKLRNR